MVRSIGTIGVNTIISKLEMYQPFFYRAQHLHPDSNPLDFCREISKIIDSIRMERKTKSIFDWNDPEKRSQNASNKQHARSYPYAYLSET